MKPERCASTHEEIARIAYFLFEERGRIEGHDVEDWLAAEAHVCTDHKHAGKIKDVAPSPKKKRKENPRER